MSNEVISSLEMITSTLSLVGYMHATVHTSYVTSVYSSAGSV